jgi:hypothetical protein
MELQAQQHKKSNLVAYILFGLIILIVIILIIGKSRDQAKLSPSSQEAILNALRSQSSGPTISAQNQAKIIANLQKGKPVAASLSASEQAKILESLKNK